MNLKEALVARGYLVVGEAGDGVSAVSLARELRPYVVIIDVVMPRLDGLQAARQLAEERIAPALLLTAYSGREQVEQARAAGVMGYLIKPFRDDDLAPAIEIAVARYAALRNADQQV